MNFIACLHWGMALPFVLNAQASTWEKKRMRKITRRNKSSEIAKEVISSKRIKRRTRVEFLSSGSTTLNLALSGKGADGGWARGRIVNIVGDGSSGKTLLALELAFWCFKNIKKIKSKIYSKIKKVSIVYYNTEGVMDFPLESMYGEDFAKTINWNPVGSKKNFRIAEHVGRDYIERLNNLKSGEFLLAIIDSWDALGSVAGDQRLEKSIKEDKEIDGSYHLEKQKYASSIFFPAICGKMETNKKDATLIIISQIRTKIGITFGKKQYRAGGKALDFFTHQVAWIREVEKLRKTRKKEKRVYGIRCIAKVERSKVAKPFRESEFTILYDYGLDNTSSQIDYLWGKRQIKFNGEKFKTKEAFIKYIEDNNMEIELSNKTERKWKGVEEAFERDVEKRKKRF